MYEEIRTMVMGIRYVMQFLGIVLFISGFLLCVAPGLVKKINELGRRLLFNDEGVLKHNVGMGILFIIIGVIVLFITSCFLPR